MKPINYRGNTSGLLSMLDKLAEKEAKKRSGEVKIYLPNSGKFEKPKIKTVNVLF